MSKLLGENKISEEALQQMRARGGTWYCYQHHALDSASLGDLQFLRCDEQSTYKTPPERMPDTQHCIGWRYVLVGTVDLETGKVVAS